MRYVTRFGFLWCAASLVVNAFTAFAASAQTTSSADLSHYDCSALTDPSVGVMHIGQVIQNVYTEWQQFYRLQNGVRLTVCIGVMRPAAKTLSSAEAIDFIARSQAIGALTQGSSTAPERAQSTYEPPTNAKPAGPLPLAPTSSDDAKRPPANHVGTRLTPLRPTPPPAGNGTPDQTPVFEKQAATDVGNRSHVVDTTVLPFNVVGQLFVTFPDGAMFVCSGTLISPYVVLTAGHCAYSADRGGFAVFATFAPGQNQNPLNGRVITPFGIGSANYVATNTSWSGLPSNMDESLTNAQNDYAAFFFPAGFSYTTTFMPVLYGDTTGGVVNTIGYPAEINGQSNFGAWISAGPEDIKSMVLDRGYQVREFSLSASPGQSGGPFVLATGGNYYIVGVLTFVDPNGVSFAGGPWTGGPNQALISSWALWTPDQGMLASDQNSMSGQVGPSKVGVRIPYALPSSTVGFSSFLRMNNADYVAGIVKVLVSDGSSGAYLGTWTSPQIPPSASLQVAMRDIEAQATPVIDPSRYHAFTLVVQSSVQGFFQHVLWNQQGQSLSNISACNTGFSQDNTNLMNVDTSAISGYPSEVVIHNLGNQPAFAKLNVWDSTTGRGLGTYVQSTPLAPDADLVLKVADIERAIEFTPTSGQSQLEIELDGGFHGYLQHFVNNTASGLIADMTAKCDLR